jgi:hypothetical protein
MMRPRRLIPALFALLGAFLALGLAGPAASEPSAEEEELAASWRYPEPAADETSPNGEEIYEDPEIVSPTCVKAVDPLECTAEEGAAEIAVDSEEDAASPEQTTVDGSVVTTSPYDDPAALETSGSFVDSPMTTDPSTSLEPPDPAPTGDSDAVRRMERGFNTLQQAMFPPGDAFNRSMEKIFGTGSVAHRLVVRWWDVQCRGPNSWNWTRYNRVVNAAHARGLRVVLGPTGSPNWARIRGRRTPTVVGNTCKPRGEREIGAASRLGPFAHPDNLNAWTVFLRRLVQHFRHLNPLGYEIWNEQNSRAFWDVTGGPNPTRRAPNPKVWTKLYCRAVTQIDAHNPGKQVGVGGLAVNAPVNTPAPPAAVVNMRASAYLQLAYRRQREQCSHKPFDYVGYHPYAFKYYYDNNDPNIGSTPTMAELRALRGVMRRHRQGRRRVWNTEWGFPSAFGRIDEPRQRTLIAAEHEYLAGAADGYGPYMRFSTLFNVVDAARPPDAPDDPFLSIGLVRLDWENKPSYEYWRSLP